MSFLRFQVLSFYDWYSEKQYCIICLMGGIQAWKLFKNWFIDDYKCSLGEQKGAFGGHTHFPIITRNLAQNVTQNKHRTISIDNVMVSSSSTFQANIERNWKKLGDKAYVLYGHRAHTLKVLQIN